MFKETKEGATNFCIRCEEEARGRNLTSSPHTCGLSKEQNKECCEKCKLGDRLVFKGEKLNCICPCHTPAEIDQECQCKSVYCKHNPPEVDTLQGDSWEFAHNIKARDSLLTAKIYNRSKNDYCLVKDLLLQEKARARDEGYECGLNLRKEYNDPKLIEQICIQEKARVIKLAEKLIWTKDKYPKKFNAELYMELDSFNEGVQEVIKILKSI